MSRVLIASALAAGAHATPLPPAEQRPTWEQRDQCIQKSGWQSCYSLDKTRSSDAYKACVGVEDKVQEMLDEGSSDACHEMDMDMDYGSYQSQLKDDYYQCVDELSKLAETNEFYYKNEFKPLFITCGTLQSNVANVSLGVPPRAALSLKNYPPADKRPTWEQRDQCINSRGYKSCYSLDTSRSSEAYKACVNVENKVQTMLEHGSTDACQQMNMDMDYGSQQDKLKDDYYQCVDDLAKVAKENEFYYKQEFEPLFITCGELQTRLANTASNVQPKVAASPPMEKRPTWEQRDQCIAKSGYDSCYSLDKARSSDAYKACADVENQVQAMLEHGSSDACHEMNMDMDYGSYQATLKDDYYQCIDELSKTAKQNEFYYDKEFTPLFIICGELQSTSTIVV